MRLLMYSYFPILKHHLAGGAQAIARDLIVGFTRSGVSVTVICPQAYSDDILEADNLHVLPILREQANRPLLLHEQQYNLQQLAGAVEGADLVWSSDRAFPLEIPQPVVLTLQTIAYANEIQNLLSFKWDVLVVASHYLSSVVQAVIGPRFWQGLAPPIVTISNGIDTDFFRPTSPDSLQERLRLPESGSYLLFPHRPDRNKGFDLVFRVLSRLHAHGQNYKLLIPTHPLSVKSGKGAEAKYYNILRSKADEEGIRSHVIFHDWILFDDRPAYFTLGTWCLTLPTIAEGFGLTPVEAISCLTPVISTRAGALRDQFPPEHGVTYVDFHAVDEIVSRIISGPPIQELQRGREYVTTHYSIRDCVSQYLSCFVHATKKSGQYLPQPKPDSLQLSPWCHRESHDTIWHDFKIRSYKLSKSERELLRLIDSSVGRSDLEQYQSEIDRLLERGILTM